MKAESLRIRLDAQWLRDLLDSMVQIEAQLLERDLLRLYLGKVQDAADERQQSPAAVLSSLYEAPLRRREVCVRKEWEHPQDSIHGGSYFFFHVGQETALRPIALIGAFPI